MEKYRVNPDYIMRKIAGESVLIMIRQENGGMNGMFLVNETFAFLWDQFTVPNTLDNVFEAAILKFADNDHSLRQDILAFVDQSRVAGMLWRCKDETYMGNAKGGAAEI